MVKWTLAVDAQHSSRSNVEEVSRFLSGWTHDQERGVLDDGFGMEADSGIVTFAIMGIFGAMDF